jgi:hypothetical protein
VSSIQIHCTVGPPGIDLSDSTYPGQSGINSLPMDWGHRDPQERGPVVVSRNPTTIRRRNGKYTKNILGIA